MYPTPLTSYSWLSIGSEIVRHEEFPLLTAKLVPILKLFNVRKLDEQNSQKTFIDFAFHTFVTIWREFTFTLEIKYNIFSLELFEEEKQIQDFFSDLFKSECEISNLAWFSIWIAISPEFLDHKYELEVFLVIWLAQHVFLRCPNDGVSQLFIPIAIKISQGMRLPLALLYLRNLYKRFNVCALHLIQSFYYYFLANSPRTIIRFGYGIIKSPKEHYSCRC
ncbi:hypothetical protein CXB51_026379 [Gossypium anomalum]|uniref:Aminotransferase-like plant mobile domain-containing protein n=1 Tax=Gossypium anomalum TaxID=47600 RepID=A0A8J5YLY6_9ROSI|nr:hypothetical protein CXB51_026379 [Gossypium anomalum]